MTEGEARAVLLRFRARVESKHFAREVYACVEALHAPRSALQVREHASCANVERGARDVERLPPYREPGPWCRASICVTPQEYAVTMGLSAAEAAWMRAKLRGLARAFAEEIHPEAAARFKGCRFRAEAPRRIMSNWYLFVVWGPENEQ